MKEVLIQIKITNHMHIIISLHNVFEAGAHEYEQGNKRKCAHKSKMQEMSSDTSFHLAYAIIFDEIFTLKCSSHYFTCSLLKQYFVLRGS